MIDRIVGDNVTMMCELRHKRRRNRDRAKIRRAVETVERYVKGYGDTQRLVPAIGKGVLRWLRCTLSVTPNGPLDQLIQNPSHEEHLICLECGGNCAPECGRHPLGCIFGGSTRLTSYWLVVPECTLSHGEEIDNAVLTT